MKTNHVWPKNLSVVGLGVACFALCAASANTAWAVTIDWITVSNPGNAGEAQSQGTFGAVGYSYRIGETEVTNSQYAEFLNAVAASDPNGLYNSFMGSTKSGGITRSGAPGTFSYMTKPGRETKSVNYVSFLDAMRFVNWLENGQPTGAQGLGTTEVGTYVLNNGLTETRKGGAKFFIPSENEWYKAAYHKNDGITGNYWEYPTQSDAVPTAEPPPGGTNSANFNAVVGDITNAGAYSSTASAYGGFDFAGNVFEWNEMLLSGSARGRRGGSWDHTGDSASPERSFLEPSSETNGTGFRVAAAASNLFFDDFNRPDGPVGNGWTTIPGPTGVDLEILDGKVVPTAPSAQAMGMYRDFGFSSPVRVQATLGSGQGGRWEHGFSPSAEPVSGGLDFSMLLSRTGSGVDNSTVRLTTTVNGVPTVREVSSTFQFDDNVDLDVTLHEDGSAQGVVVGSEDEFRFAFGPSPFDQIGSQFYANLPAHAPSSPSSLDDVRITRLDALPQTTRNAPPNPATIYFPTDGGRLKLLDDMGNVIPNGSPDPTLPTVVLTHGFLSSIDAWPKDVATALGQQNVTANVVAWDWEDDAFTINLPLAGAKSLPHGALLAAALLNELGIDYTNDIQFIGHSLGSIVNKYAADGVHNFLDPSRTQVSILDSPEFVAELLIPWSNPIPNEAGFIDNYVSAFGNPHEEAVNVLLFEDMPISIGVLDLVLDGIEFHERPHQWYKETIDMQNGSLVGFRHSFVHGSGGKRPGPSTYFKQSDGQGPLGIVVEEISELQATSLVLARNLRLVGGLAITASAGQVFSTFSGVAETSGQVGVWATKLGVTSASDDVFESIDFLLNEGPSEHGDNSGFIWLPLSLPERAEYLTFDLFFSGLSDNDLFAVAINDTQVFAQSGTFANSTEAFAIDGIDVSTWAGQDIELFVGLSADGVGTGLVSIRNLLFYNQLACDFNLDDVCDLVDLNMLLQLGPVAEGVGVILGDNEEFDLNGDGSLGLADLDEWLAMAAAENGLASSYKLGDANLDGVVDGQDFVLWNANKFTSSLLWDDGDFNGDGLVDGRDFLHWNENKFTSSNHSTPVPESSFAVYLLLGGTLLILCRTYQSACCD